jgi:hypothetical protein
MQRFSQSEQSIPEDLICVRPWSDGDEVLKKVTPQAERPIAG